jgi:hypothetical protein
MVTPEARWWPLVAPLERAPHVRRLTARRDRERGRKSSEFTRSAAASSRLIRLADLLLPAMGSTLAVRRSADSQSNGLG